jgi:hypothetical protein
MTTTERQPHAYGQAHSRSPGVAHKSFDGGPSDGRVIRDRNGARTASSFGTSVGNLAFPFTLINIAGYMEPNPRAHQSYIDWHQDGPPPGERVAARTVSQTRITPRRFPAISAWTSSPS